MKKKSYWFLIAFGLSFAGVMYLQTVPEDVLTTHQGVLIAMLFFPVCIIAWCVDVINAGTMRRGKYSTSPMITREKNPREFWTRIGGSIAIAICIAIYASFQLIKRMEG